jgi:hypothetical protein
MSVSLETTLRVAERVAEVLRAHQIDSIVIGGMALAVHKYPRDTDDFDLAVATPPATLRSVAQDLRGEGWEVELREPDGDDPLGGVIDIQAPDADLVQVVNFDNSPTSGFPRLVREALVTGQPFSSDSPLRVVDLPMLIAFKLYAGGAQSKNDVLVLLERADPSALDQVRAKCAELRLEKKLERVLELRRDED